MSVYSDVTLMNGHDDTVYSDFFPTPFSAASMQALVASDKNDLNVVKVGVTAAAVLAPGKRPFTVGKPAEILDINHFHFSGHLNERMLTETRQRHGINRTGGL